MLSMLKTVFISIIITFVLVFTQTNTYAQDSVKYIGIGSYYVFYKNQTFKYYSIPCDICPPYADKNNVISYGYYSKDPGRAYYLYSDIGLNSNKLELIVDEKMINEKKREVSLDIPAHKDSADPLGPRYFYCIELIFLKDSFDSMTDVPLLYIDPFYTKSYYSETPFFEIPFDDNNSLRQIVVKIYPKQQSRVSFAEGTYKVTNPLSNSFHIAVPQFVSGFLDYQRMNGFRIELFGDTLIGDGMRTFVREDVYLREHFSPYNFPSCPDWRYHNTTY